MRMCPMRLMTRKSSLTTDGFYCRWENYYYKLHNKKMEIITHSCS